MKIAFFGLPLGALLLAHDGHAPLLSVLSPVDAPGRRRLERLPGAVLVDARALSEEELATQVDEHIAALRPDLVVSWYWTRRLPPRWLGARLGAIGVHPSLLPRHRGPDPFFWAIDAGDRETGVTVHRLTAEYDEGDVLLTEALPVGGQNAWQLARALDRPSLRLLRRAVRTIAEGGALVPVPQDAGLATWAPEPTGELLRADFRGSTGAVLRRIRALSPVPGLLLEIRGVRLSVTAAEAASAVETPGALEPGEAGITDSSVLVRTGDGAIRVCRATIDEGDDEPTEVGAVALARRLG